MVSGLFDVTFVILYYCVVGIVPWIAVIVIPVRHWCDLIGGCLWVLVVLDFYNLWKNNFWDLSKRRNFFLRFWSREFLRFQKRSLIVEFLEIWSCLKTGIEFLMSESRKCVYFLLFFGSSVCRWIEYVRG